MLTQRTSVRRQDARVSVQGSGGSRTAICLESGWKLQKRRESPWKDPVTRSRNDTQDLVNFLTRNGQALLTTVELIEQSQMPVDSRWTCWAAPASEALLRLSAEGIAGPPHPGKRGGAVGSADSRKGSMKCQSPFISKGSPDTVFDVSGNE